MIKVIQEILYSSRADPYIFITVCSHYLTKHQVEFKVFKVKNNDEKLMESLIDGVIARKPEHITYVENGIDNRLVNFLKLKLKK